MEYLTELRLREANGQRPEIRVGEADEFFEKTAAV
jgi:hypothetical protein